jgi:hypothetical protein
VAAALLIACVPALLQGCVFHRGAKLAGCQQPQFAGDTRNLPALRIPPGLNAPNTAGGVHVPTLSTPEPVRVKTAPCLDFPPNYVSEPQVPPTRRPS